MSVLEENKRIVKNFLRKEVFLVLVLFIVVVQNAYTQTYALPDTALRNKLLVSYPSVMSGNLLNITAAGSLTGTLDLSNASISNADGIQYFTTINSLNIKNNMLTSIPDISGLTQLMSLFLSYNNLVTIPSLSSFTNLIDFQASNNQLTALPSFSGNPNLMIIYCQNNQLTTLPDISMLTNLQVLVIGNNQFNQLPDFSPLVNLVELHVHLTGIDTIIGLSALTNLEVLYAWGNKIRDFSALNANTTLEKFSVYSNELKTLPVLSNKPSLVHVSIDKNFLTVEDILPLPSFTTFNYHPQKQIFLASYTVREKESVSFNLLIDQGITDNLYSWYKDGTLLTTNQTGIYKVENASYSDSGKYYVQITNPGLTGLTLYTDTASLHVKPCLEINSFVTEYLSENCQEGLGVQLADLNIGGGIAPFEYSIVTINKTDTLFLATPQFQSVSPGVHTVLIRDVRMCKAIKTISIRNPVGCAIVISPNGDGIMDAYFIEEPGRVKIVDMGRNLVRELTTPGEWDGRKSNGMLVEDGYYAIVINENKVLNVTVVK